MLTEQLNLSKSKRFASKSEEHSKGTFNEAEQQNNPDPKHHKKGRKPLPDTLERETRVHTKCTALSLLRWCDA
ncbi:transposase [Photobacterium swingsii]|uniref:transposase n=1 Tax=Photobacterium swingsii TaxID=680026 RepID=UPI001EFB8E6E|nr:transposase [Photobacterium swingsii]